MTDPAEQDVAPEPSLDNPTTDDYTLKAMLAAIESESDLNTVIETLQNGEATAFRSLLAEYVLEG